MSMIRCVGLRKFWEEQKATKMVATPRSDSAEDVRPAMDS